MSRDSKENTLRRNVETAVEREMRQIEQAQKRERLPGEKEKLRGKWEDSANRIDRTKLNEVWNK